jgi:crotonobetainyl-CoA:carnitine CoA-transferase CaiB-like acyl-CoA transferase
METGMMQGLDFLSGVRVVELAQFVMVPSSAAMLADLGAEVLKIEPPEGDPYRSLVVDKREVGAPNFSMEQNNRGKKSLVIDLKQPAGREAFRAVLAGADVFMTSLRPAALKRLGADPETLIRDFPRLVYARANGLGFKGLEADKPGFDASAYWARGGFAHMLAPSEDQLARQPRAVGDHAAAMNLAFGVASALLKRERTGQGALVETSLLHTAAWILSNDIVACQLPGQDESNVTQRVAAANPLVRAYRTRDRRWLQLTFLDPDRFWPGLCATLERPELAADPRFAEAAARSRNSEACSALLAEIIGARDWDGWQGRFAAFDAPWELARQVKDVFDDPQAIANEHLFEIELASGARTQLVSTPLHMDGEVAAARRRAPDCGQHTDEVLRAAGLTADSIADLRARGAVA